MPRGQGERPSGPALHPHALVPADLRTVIKSPYGVHADQWQAHVETWSAGSFHSSGGRIFMKLLTQLLIQGVMLKIKYTFFLFTESSTTNWERKVYVALQIVVLPVKKLS